MSSHRKAANQQRAKSALAFLSDSATDYIAARTLLLAELPQQGAILASTAIEKVCKAILAFHGNSSHGHLKQAHWKSVQMLSPELFATLDTEFLALNKKVYQLRYTDDLPDGFNLVIACREFLAALDWTIIALHSSLQLDSEHGAKTKLNTLLEIQDIRLCDQNHVLAGIDRTEFVLSAPQLVYEVRFSKSRGLLELSYLATGPANSPGFSREGCRVVDSSKQVYVSSHNALRSEA